MSVIDAARARLRLIFQRDDAQSRMKHEIEFHIHGIDHTNRRGANNCCTQRLDKRMNGVPQPIKPRNLVGNKLGGVHNAGNYKNGSCCE